MSAAEPSLLALFWVGVIVFAILAYVILDGFDLGIGVLSGIAGSEARRDQLMEAIAPFWDGNETWLVVTAASLFAGFPAAYSIFLSAFYIPVLLLLWGLIFRGVAFEFRYRDARRSWNKSFFAGSIVAAFMQGAAVGAMIRGIPVVDGQYAGGPFIWLAPLPVLCGIGLVLGYALLGAGWLVLKSEDALREWAWRQIPWLAIATLVVLIVAFGVALPDRERIGTDLMGRLWGLVFPIIGLLAIAGVIVAARRRRDDLPFALAVVFFVAAMLTLVVLFWPYMIPYELTVADAAAPDASLSFLSWAAIIVLPLIAAYTFGVYWVFRGKLAKAGGTEWADAMLAMNRGSSPMRLLSLRTLLAAIVVIGIATGGLLYVYWNQAVPLAALAINYARYWSAPPGTLETEVAPSGGTVQPTALSTSASQQSGPGDSENDWPSYNKTLTSQRYSQLSQINRTNADKLKVLCTYDTGQFTGFTSGLLEVSGALIFVTEYDIFSVDPSTCRENWRTHEHYTPATPQGVNRGAAYLDGMLFRGTQDGRVLAYDFKTGKRIWQATIADPSKGESVPAAPIAWNGLVFVGNAGGDIKGVKGRMYALDAKTGKIVWEFYLVPKSETDPTRGPQGASPLNAASWGNSRPGVPITGGATWTTYSLDPDTGLLYVPGGNPAPDFAAGVREGSNLYSGSVVVLDAKTGAYKNHFKIVPKDWHDWDVSGAPAIVNTAAGKKVLLVAPKDGHLYAFDLETNDLLYKQPVTRIENEEAPFVVGKPVHFCPGSTGGAEWNGPAYDPGLNVVFIGEIEWCTTVTLMPTDKIASAKPGTPWSGEASINPFNTWGKADPVFDWAGWVYAVDADAGDWRWRAKTDYPIQSGMTPTAGGVVFFGDMGGNFYALDTANGRRLWGQKIGGAIGGGVITYADKGTQKIAVATGLTEILWPTEITTAKVSILGLE